MSKSTSSSGTPKSSGKPVGGINKSSSKEKGVTKITPEGKLSHPKVNLPKHGDLSAIGEDHYYDEHYAKAHQGKPSSETWKNIKIKTSKKK